MNPDFNVMISFILKMKTRQGTELLIQSDNDISIMEWFRVLEYAISNQVNS